MYNSKLSEENLLLYKKMIGMRNRIVHDYDRISNEILYMIHIKFRIIRIKGEKTKKNSIICNLLRINTLNINI